ncbi:Uncharacterised protein [Vibrio cholerae]|nr:Uncharacterised protein [Vibrio cholerae]
MTVGRTCQWYQRLLACHKVFLFNRITNRVNRWIAGLHLLVNPNTTEFSELQTGFRSQFGFWAYTNRHDQNVGS